MTFTVRPDWQKYTDRLSVAYQKAAKTAETKAPADIDGRDRDQWLYAQTVEEYEKLTNPRWPKR